MNTRLSRRSFLGMSFIGLAAFISACAKALNPPIDESTPTPAMTATPDTTLRTYTPEDPNILYTGRIDFSIPKVPKFSAPGVYIQARFRGSSASVLLQDEFKWGTSRNYYDAIIDDTTVVKIAPEKSVTKYVVASGLPYGEHSLSLVKRTEAGVGFCQFLGFEFAGEILPPPEKPARRMEFIGDSISCGSGNEAAYGSDECEADGWGQPYQNARLAFGPLLARKLKAAYHVTAVAGIGLVRNYSFKYDARPLPEVYAALFLEQTDSPAWDTARFIPDALVIALGTNDFSPGDSERPSMKVADFVTAYVEFIKKLREYYPDAALFCVSSPMLGDHWPTGGDMFATDQIDGINKTVAQCNATGDAKVYKFMSTRIVGLGCGTHPDVEQHALMANELGTYVAKVMGW